MTQITRRAVLHGATAAAQTPPELRSGSVIPNGQRGDILIWALQANVV